jgi:hypothetical protein
MRVCSSLLSLALLLGGCGERSQEYGFSIEAVEAQVGYQKIHARLEQQLVLSHEASNALEHGVPLELSVDLELRDAQSLTLLADDQHRFVIRYLPLSRHYQLADLSQGATETFPRLRHALAALASLELPLQTGPLAPGQYEIRIRTRLEHGSMPAPMRLPALLSAKWRHDSEWSTWPIVISA